MPPNLVVLRCIKMLKLFMREKKTGGGGEREDQLIIYVQSSLKKAQKILIFMSYWYWKLVLILNPHPSSVINLEIFISETNLLLVFQVA